eukprot:3992567-Pyramimonas_sp.AAC.2
MAFFTATMREQSNRQGFVAQGMMHIEKKFAKSRSAANPCSRDLPHVRELKFGSHIVLRSSPRLALPARDSCERG